jgi:hypothetical protein
MTFSVLFGLLLLVQASAISPEQFFVGRTEGTGTVHVMLSGRHAVRVHSRGRVDPSGVLLLDQRVEEEGKPVRTTRWRLARSRQGRITGSIVGGRGPVTGEMAGNVLRLRYRSAEGPQVEQSITFHPDGRTAHNRMIYRRFGLTVATVEETIRRVD